MHPKFDLTGDETFPLCLKKEIYQLLDNGKKYSHFAGSVLGIYMVGFLCEERGIYFQEVYSIPYSRINMALKTFCLGLFHHGNNVYYGCDCFVVGDLCLCFY